MAETKRDDDEQPAIAAEFDDYRKRIDALTAGLPSEPDVTRTKETDMETDHDDGDDEARQFIEDQSLALQQQLSGFLEGRLGAESPIARVTAATALGAVLVRLLVTDCLRAPDVLPSALALLDGLRRQLHDRVTATVVVPGESRH